MNCDTARELILDAIDAPWEAAGGKALEEHLAGCETCAGFRQIQLDADQALIAGFANVAPSPALAARILAGAEEPVANSTPGWVPDLLNAAGAGFMAAVLASLNLPAIPNLAAILAALTLIAVVSYPLLLLRRG
jgi:anti-sigma factor RsiW